MIPSDESFEVRLPASDVFVAHASPDKPKAEALCAALTGLGVTPFLDKADISPGDGWDLLLQQALRETRLAAVLVGPTYDAAHYLRDEVVKFIALYRAPASTLRIVPVFLEGFPSETWRIPYGLGAFNGLSWPGEGGAAGVASRLTEALGGMGGAPALAELPTPPVAPAELTGKKRYAVLTKLLRAQFEKVQFLCDAPAADLPPDTQPLSTRAIALTLWLDQQPLEQRLEFDALLRKEVRGLF